MQPAETFTVPRRILDVEDYIDILRRHKGWIFGPLLLCLVASVVGVYLWPDTYVSEGAIKIEQQQISPNLVQVAVTQDMIDQINSMEATIESRNVLTNIITTYDLYPKERSRETMEDVVEMMKGQIDIHPLGAGDGRNVPAFRIAFSYPDKHKAQKVVEDLIGRFTSEASRNQSSKAFEATELLKDESEQAKKELDGIENQLTTYMTQNNGRLPDQRAENYQRLQSLEAGRASLNTEISRLTQDKLMLENNLSIIKQQAEEIAAVKPEISAASPQRSARLIQADNQVEALQNLLEQLQQRYQDSHPDVKNTKEQLALAQANRDKIAAEETAAAKKQVLPGRPGVTAANFRDDLQNEANVSRIQASIGVDDNQIEDAKKQLKMAEEDIKIVQGRMSAVPQSQQEYDGLLRERDLKRAQYEDMTKRLATAQVQQDVENKKEGQTMEVLDAASDPTTPAYPKHGVVIGIGAGIGLLLGIMIAGAREMKDTSLKNLKDVRAYTQMPILGSVPLLENDFVVRRRKRMAWLGWTTACLTAVLLMSGSVVYYYTTKQQ